MGVVDDMRAPSFLALVSRLKEMISAPIRERTFLGFLSGPDDSRPRLCERMAGLNGLSPVLSVLASGSIHAFLGLVTT